MQEYSAIVEDGGLGKAASLVLVAREKESGRVVGYCRADHGDEELRIAQLKAPVFQGGFPVKLRRCGLSPDLLSFEVLLLSEPLLTLVPAAPEVHGDHQQKGVGKLLIQAAETQARKRERGALTFRKFGGGRGGALAVSVYRIIGSLGQSLGLSKTKIQSLGFGSLCAFFVGAWASCGSLLERFHVGA